MLVHHWPEPRRPARAVLLGGSGFLGRSLGAALAQAGVPVLTPGRAALDLAAEGAADRLAACLEPDDAVVFLAALTPDRGRGTGTFLANLRMGDAVAGALAKVTPAHVVYLSSDAVYALDGGVTTEETCPRPEDLYGMMHLAREMMVRTATAAPVAVLRPTLLYGAADTHNSYGPNRLRRQARREGRITLFGAGEEMRDHLAVEDAAALLLDVLCHRSAGLLNLATGRSVAYRDLAERVAAQFAPPAAVVCTERRQPITHRHFGIAALHRAFPAFAFTPLEEGLARAHRAMLATEPEV